MFPWQLGIIEFYVLWGNLQRNPNLISYRLNSITRICRHNLYLLRTVIGLAPLWVQWETQGHTLTLAGLERTDKKDQKLIFRSMCLKFQRPQKSGILSLNKPNIHLHFFSYTIYNFPADMERMQMIITLRSLVVKRENLDTCCDYSLLSIRSFRYRPVT